MHSAAGNMKSDVHRCTSPRSFSVLVDFQCCVWNRRGLEGTVRNCFLFVCLLNNEFFVVIMFEDNNRTLRVLPRYNKTIVASCDWVHGFVHPRGKMAPSASPCGAISPLGRTKRRGPCHSVQVPWLHSAEGNMSDVNRCILPWSFPPLVDFQRLVWNSRGFEGTVKSCL